MKSFLSAAALAAAALCASAPASAAIALIFTPASTHINVGDSVAIEVSITGLDAEVLSGFDLNFLYNSTVLDWTLTEYFGANLGNSFGLNDMSVNGNLAVDDISIDDDATLAANQANSFLLFRFHLDGKANGATTFTLGADPDFDRNHVGLQFATLNVNVGSACISVGTGSCDVPEPASYGLAAVALLAAGFAGRTRRRNARTAA